MSDVSHQSVRPSRHASELMRCAPSRPFPQQHRLVVDSAARLGRGKRLHQKEHRNHARSWRTWDVAGAEGATQKSSSAIRAFRFGFRLPALVIGQARFCADEQARVKKLPSDFLLVGRTQRQVPNTRRVRFFGFWVSPVGWLWPCDGRETDTTTDHYYCDS